MPILAQGFDPGMDLLMQILLILAGGYALYTCRNMDRWAKLPGSKFIYPYGCPTSTCEDPAALKKFLKPRLLVFGIWSLAAAAISLVVSYVFDNNPIYAMILAAFVMADLVYYLVIISKASSKFW